MSDFLRDEVMRIMQAHRGRNSAITRTEILSHLQMFDQSLDDRALRRLYSCLPICTCPDGLFLPKEPGEVEEFNAYLTPKVGPIVASRRCRTIYAYYPSLCPVRGEQKDLFRSAL